MQTGSKTLNKTMNSTQNKGVPSEKPKKQELSSEEIVMAQPISNVEQALLTKVFYLLCKQTKEESNLDSSFASKQDKNADNSQIGNADKSKNYFTAKDVQKIILDLGYDASKTEIDQMIWEIDDKLDGKINLYEFELMYKRCSLDTTGLEPRNLYNVVQFLMFLQNNPEEGKQSKKITVENTLELLYVRHGRNKLDQEIEEIFGKDQKTADGQEQELSLTEYLQKIKKKDFVDRERLQKERNTVKIPGKEDEYI